MSDPLELVKKLAKDLDGKISEWGILPDGTGFAVMDLPLPKDHWIYQEVNGDTDPPAPMRMGVENPLRKPLEKALESAAKYAVKMSTVRGQIIDFDPDAMVRNFIVGMLGYYTGTGFSDLD